MPKQGVFGKCKKDRVGDPRAQTFLDIGKMDKKLCKRNELSDSKKRAVQGNSGPKYF
jgi:hypothetical protein